MPATNRNNYTIIQRKENQMTKILKYIILQNMEQNHLWEAERV